MQIKFSSPVSQSVGSSKQKCWLTFKALMSAAHSLILIYSSALRQNIKSLVFVSARAAELPWIALHPPFGAEGGELHECSECFFISPFSFLFFSLTKQNRSFYPRIIYQLQTGAGRVFSGTSLWLCTWVLYHCLIKAVTCCVCARLRHVLFWPCMWPLRVDTQGMPLVSGFHRCWNWLTPKPTSRAWICCILLPW